jgi:hypothetical protein
MAVKFVKGMSKDTGRMDQIDGTYRDALNAIMDGVKGSISNEYGNKWIGSLLGDHGEGLLPVGQIALPDDNFLIFAVSQDGIDSFIIYVEGKAGTPLTLLKTPADNLAYSSIGDLQFDVEHPITGEYRLSPTGDIIAYFTDNKYTQSIDATTGIEYLSQFNPPRVFNVSKQKRAVESGVSFYKLYSNGDVSINSLNLFQHATRIPEFDSIKLLQGGGVVSGTYFLGLAYADSDLTETNVLTLSNPVYIVPADDNTIPREMISGSPAEMQTNKSILWKVNAQNVDYKFVIPFIIQFIGKARFAYKLEPVEIKVGTLTEVVYSGLENSAQSAIEEVIIDKVKYATAKALCQLDNKLYAANLTGRKDLGYQRFANNIQLTVGATTITKFDPRRYDIFNLNEGYAKLVGQNRNQMPSYIEDATTFYQREAELVSYMFTNIIAVQRNNSKGYRDVESLLFKNKTYRRGEVYAFYISFILDDGSESYAYHIPGRKTVHPIETKGINEIESLVNFKGLEIFNVNPSGKVFQYLDTTVALAPLGITSTTGYWENSNETYPVDSNFDIHSVTADGNPSYIGTLAGQKVRHHKMPSNHNPTFSYLKQNTDFSTPNIASETTNEGDVVFNEQVRLLYIKLNNLRIPKFILEQVQGYKVYYAKRTQPNKTIIGQSGLQAGIPYLAANLSPTISDGKEGPYHNMWYFYATPNTAAIGVADGAWTRNTYLSQPVVKFHDFNLLRKKHTLATATHIDVQYVVTMQNWHGGYKGAKKDATHNVYLSFRAGHGDDEHAWVHPDLGNTINFEYNPDQAGYDVWGPPTLYGKVLIGAKYNAPGTANIDVGVATGSAGYLNQSQMLSNLQTIFMLDPEGATYIAGLAYLKNINSTAFKGATYLVNNSGESAIALSMISGVPVLKGYFSSGWGGLSASHIVKSPLSVTVTLPPPTGTVKQDIGRPNVYLANLCSAKTDVFEPFDQQPLVWTGHYQPLLFKETTTGIAYDDEAKKFKQSYYAGATSAPIYGGDTYITRYGYRSTSQDHSIVRFRRGDNEEPNPIDYVSGDIPFDLNTGLTANFKILNQGNASQRLDTINNENNWINGDTTVSSTLYQFIVESDDNINFRHCGDVEAGVTPAKSVYFDKFTAADVLYKTPLNDLTKMDHLLYEDHYSAVQDLRVTIPFPKRDKSTNLYPNRVIRSNVQDGNFNDAYRYFLALEYKDFGQNKGPITNIFNLNALLYIHTENSLFRTKGKQTMALSDANQAYIGSGDLFAQEPDEFIQSQEGYLGNYNKLSSLITKDGYFYLGYKARKIFLVSDKVTDLTLIGMDTWARENIPFTLEAFGYDFTIGEFNTDAPTSYFGFSSSYDPLFKRIIITKRELKPTSLFINAFNRGDIIYSAGKNTFYNNKNGLRIPIAENQYFYRSGWTVSFSTDFGVWSSRHSYIPPMYAYNSKFMYSMSPGGSGRFYVHNDINNPGLFYDDLYNFEFEFINTGKVTTTMQGTMSDKDKNKLFYAVSFTADVLTKSPTSFYRVLNTFDPGFNEYLVYNTTQLSEKTTFKYLENVRKTDNTWIFNDFRDNSATSLTTHLDVGQVPIGTTGPYMGTTVPGVGVPMFLEEGVVNDSYNNASKQWYEKRKFVDKFVGVRLYANNESKSLINLYTAEAAYRTSNR